MLHPLLGPIMPGTMFLIAAVLVEYYCGLGPAVLVMLIGMGLADFLFVPPYGQIEVIDASDFRLLVSFPLITIVVITLVERLRRAQYRAELLALVAQSRYEMLLRHDNERMLARRAVDETHRLLRHLSHHHKTFVFIQALERNALHPADDVKPQGVLPRLPNEIAPGPRFADVDPDDIQRVSKALWPGNHRVRLKSGDGPSKLTECVCERFTTHAGEFLVLRIGA